MPCTTMCGTSNFKWRRHVRFVEVRTLRHYALAMSLNPLRIYLIKPLHVQFIIQYPAYCPVIHVTEKFMHSYAPVYIQTMLHQLNVTCFRFWHRAAASTIIHYRFATFTAQLMPFVYQRPHNRWFLFNLFNISFIWTGVCPRPRQNWIIACFFNFSSGDIFA